ncbi:recombinase [Campylobacter sp. RM16192]|uniref:recombinase n=1 Tax=Campylobacter sp. RM16192 TaxID=1660080 RepID=UPI0014514618|nr:recombinase [Campylobacter sp. RM16192]QCD52611.1 site-specific recombinase [Campylobacter sp. RM16192]
MKNTKDINVEFEKLLKDIEIEETDVVAKLKNLVDFIRPGNLENIDLTESKINVLIEFFNQKSEISNKISDEVNLFFIKLKLSNNISKFGILSKNGFGYEIKERFYNKFLPNPPNKGELRYLFATLFKNSDDHKWICNIDDEKWIELFSSIFSNSTHIHSTKKHLFHELLYAMEILSIRIASEEFDHNFIRLDNTILNRDSAFIALQRDVAKFVSKMQDDHIEISSTKLDLKHLEVLIEQCKNQIDKFKKKSVNLGISIAVTYELERLIQIIKRVEDILELIKKFDTKESSIAFIKFFKESAKRNSTRNSLSEVYRQSSRIVAKSITNNISEHGEHYTVDNKKEYFKMFLKSAGAGVIIAFMALLKINIVQSDFSFVTQTILIGLNYGLGFVIISLIGFTVATKQPAMTASTFAKEVEKEEDNMANQDKLIGLIFKVSRSQFASVVGNVSLALLTSFLVAHFIINGSGAILNPSEASYYLKNLEPFVPLFFAAIAGVWLFCSGLISGYFDNRADCLELKERFYHHPWLKKVLGDDKRLKLAEYIHDHLGTVAGNFFFGILLGITPFIGHILNLPLDIAHVAFSSANLGYASTHLQISYYDFLYYLACVFLIGSINLIVSFALALKVSLISRDTSIGNLFSFLKKLVKQMLKRPHELIFPFKNRLDE